MTDPRRDETDTKPDNKADKAERRRLYWRANLRLTVGLLLIWFAVSFGAGILFRDALDRVTVGTAPLGFWMAQQGSILVFFGLIVIYCIRMTQLERRYGIKG